MRHVLLTSLLLSSALTLGACAGGYSGSFRSFKGHGAGRPVAASQVKTFADKASVERLSKLEKELADLKEEQTRLQSHWQQEKDAIQRSSQLKEQLEEARVILLQRR